MATRSELEALSPLTSILRGTFPETLLETSFALEAPMERRLRALIHRTDTWLANSPPDILADVDGGPSPAALAAMRELGLFGLVVPEKYGGIGFNQTAYARFAEHLYAHSPALALTVGAHSSIAIKALLLFGTNEQKDRFLPQLATGELIGAFCLTEEQAGSDVRAIETTAVQRGEQYILNGRKIFSTNGSIAGLLTVFARETINGSDRLSAFLVPTNLAGVRQLPGDPKMGIRAVDVGTIELDNVQVPAENLVGPRGDGFRMAMTILNSGRLGLAASYIGSMKEIYANCLRHAKERRTFGIPLIENQLIQSNLMTMKDDIYSAESMVYLTTRLADAGLADASIEAALNKVFCTEAAWNCADLGVQLFGGTGYMATAPMERHLRDARIGRIFEGTNEILRLFSGLKCVKEKGARLAARQEETRTDNPVRRLVASTRLAGMFVEDTVSRRHFELPTTLLHRSLGEEAKVVAETIRELHEAAAFLMQRHRKGEKLASAQIRTSALADIAIAAWRSLAVLVRLNAILRDRGTEQSDTERRAERDTAVRILRFAARKARRRLEELRAWEPGELATATEMLNAEEKYTFKLFS